MNERQGKAMNEIETERLWLRLFRPDDLDELALIFSDAEVVKHIGSGRPASREETEVALHSIINHWERHGFGRWAAICKQSRRLIGYCGLRSFHGVPELVYLLVRDCWGLGLATEMAWASLKFGFIERKFDHIVAMAKLANLASQHVMKKVGMRFEGNAVICDMEVACYSISRQSYLSGSNIPELARGDSLIISEAQAEQSSLLIPAT